jgi:hypothetical protein
MKRFARDGRKGISRLFGFSKRTHRAKSDPYFKICKLNRESIRQASRVDILCPREEFDVLIHPG